MVKVPPSVAGLKFSFQQQDIDIIPNNCPLVIDKDGNPLNDDPETGMRPATKEFKTLGIFPVANIMRRGFREDPQFPWKQYWEEQCSSKEGSTKIDVDELLDDFGAMQRKELGNLVTGVTTFTGDIGRKAILDGDKELAGKIYDNLMSFADYIEDGINKKSFPDSVKKSGTCSKERLPNCQDALARTFQGIGKMTVASIESGLHQNKKASRSLVNRTISVDDLGARSGGADFSKNPYKVGVDTLYRCMIESEDGSLKRDMCTEMLKDVIVAGIKSVDDDSDKINAIDNEIRKLSKKDTDDAREKIKVLRDDRKTILKPNIHVYDDGLKHLGGYYDSEFFDGKNDKWRDMKTWVNSTIWLTLGLMDAMDLEDRGLLSDANPGTSDLIKTIGKQKKENLKEFSTSDWITQQAMIITGNKKIFNHHPEIIKNITGDRLSIWNPWMTLYLKNFETCPETNLECMGDAKSTQNMVLRQLASSVKRRCIDPLVTKENAEGELQGIDKTSLNTCSNAMAEIIRKVGNEVVLKEATDAYFLYGQEGKGKVFSETVKEKLEEAINDRFTAPFVDRMKNSRKRGLTEKGKTTTEVYESDLFKFRPYKISRKKDENRFAIYLMEVTASEGRRGTKTRLILDESKPLYKMVVKPTGRPGFAVAKD